MFDWVLNTLPFLIVKGGPTEDHENTSDHSTPQVADVSNVPDHPDVKLVR